MVTILATASVTGSAIPLTGSTPLITDCIWALTATSVTSSPSIPSSLSGCGATWTMVFSTARCSVWRGDDPTSIGTVTLTGGSSAAAAAWWTRGASDDAQCSADSGTGPITLSAAAVSVGASQAALGVGRAVDSMPATGSLPSVGAWTASAPSGRKIAYATPTTPDTYQLVGTGSLGTTHYAMVQAVIGIPPPTAPTGLTLTPGLTNILTSWTAPTGTPATGYTVKVGAAAPVDVGNVTSYDATGLTSGTNYTIEVKAYNDGGTSAAVSDSATTLELPDPPTSLTQTAATSTTVDVGWVAPAAGPAPTSYDRRTDGGPPVDVGLVTTAQITGLTPVTAYTIEIRSVSAGGVSTWVSVEATTDEAPPAPVGSTDPRAWHINPESRRVAFPAEDRRWAIPPESRTLRMRTP